MRIASLRPVFRSIEACGEHSLIGEGGGGLCRTRGNLECRNLPSSRELIPSHISVSSATGSQMQQNFYPLLSNNSKQHTSMS